MVTEAWIRKKVNPWYLRVWQRITCFFVGHVYSPWIPYWREAGHKDWQRHCERCGKVRP